MFAVIAMSAMFQSSASTKSLLNFGDAFRILEFKFILEGEFMGRVMTIVLFMHEAIDTQSVVSTCLAQNISHNAGYSQ